MEFTWNAYEELIRLIKREGYRVVQYHESKNMDAPCVILRHDIDNSVEKALQMAVREMNLGVSSTFFVLLTSEFYNVASAASGKMLREMNQMGHRIGLHFDESIYFGKTDNEIKDAAEKERMILEQILEIPIREISMHRPSKRALEADWNFSTMINSYGKEFFHNFKYVSDSRMHWREDVTAIIGSHEYDKLHILTHAFWYGDDNKSTKQKLEEFMYSAPLERWESLNNNFRDLEEFVPKIVFYK